MGICGSKHSQSVLTSPVQPSPPTSATFNVRALQALSALMLPSASPIDARRHPHRNLHFRQELDDHIQPNSSECHDAYEQHNDGDCVDIGNLCHREWNPRRYGQPSLPSLPLPSSSSIPPSSGSNNMVASRRTQRIREVIQRARGRVENDENDANYEHTHRGNGDIHVDLRSAGNLAPVSSSTSARPSNRKQRRGDHPRDAVTGRQATPSSMSSSSTIGHSGAIETAATSSAAAASSASACVTSQSLQCDPKISVQANTTKESVDDGLNDNNQSIAAPLSSTLSGMLVPEPEPGPIRTGPIRFSDIVDDSKDGSGVGLRRSATRLLKKLNHDPWDEFNKYNDADVFDYIHHHPETVAIQYDFDHFSGYIYPLSVLCTLGASVKTIEYAYNLYKPSMEEHDVWIGTPLHYACSYRATSAVINFLVSTHPPMLQKQNQFGRTPLHMACLFKASSETITILLEMYPRAAVLPEKDGYTPLHLACENGASADVVSLLVRSNPETCLAVTERGGSTPLHLACSCHNIHPSVIQALLSCGSGCCDGSAAARILDGHGMLPLHLAIKNQVSATVVEQVVLAAPESIHVPTGGGGGGGGGGGMTAYRIAKRNTAPERILRLLAV